MFSTLDLESENTTMDHAHCTITDADRCRLGSLLTTREGRAWGTRRWLGELDSLLDEAAPIDPERVPETLVTMNTTVELVDCESGTSCLATLVYPQDVDLVPDGVSIFDPLGIALIGCKEGDVVQCPDEHCKRTKRIERIVYQPEQDGMHHL